MRIRKESAQNIVRRENGNKLNSVLDYGENDVNGRNLWKVTYGNTGFSSVCQWLRDWKVKQFEKKSVWAKMTGTLPQFFKRQAE